MHTLTATLLGLSILLSACAKPPVNSYCELYQRKDFCDSGLRKQSRFNMERDKINEGTADRLKCPPPPRCGA